MKSILVFFLVLCFGDAKAQEEAHGYYITLTNDTVHSSYKLKTMPGFFTPADNLYEELPVLKQGKEKIKFKPSEIKGFYIEWKDNLAHFISMPIRNGKLKFLHVILLSPQLNIYEYSVPGRYGVTTQFALRRAQGDTLYVGPDDGNQKTKKRLKKFFEGQDNILSIMSTIKELFTRPGLVQDDMQRLIDKILDSYKQEEG